MLSRPGTAKVPATMAARAPNPFECKPPSLSWAELDDHADAHVNKQHVNNFPYMDPKTHMRHSLSPGKHRRKSDSPVKRASATLLGMSVTSPFDTITTQIAERNAMPLTT